MTIREVKPLNAEQWKKVMQYMKDGPTPEELKKQERLVKLGEKLIKSGYLKI